MDAYRKLSEIYDDVKDAHREAKTKEEMQYWQGKKDGLRTALAEIGNDQQARTWNLLQRSAGTQRATEREILRSMVKDAHRICWNLMNGGPYRELDSDAENFVEWVNRMKVLETEDESG